jgi:hypothetical protein
MDLMDPGTPTRSTTVELHIDELVLHGFAAKDRHLIAAALERELSRLIAQGDLAHLPAASVQLDRLDAGSFHLDPAARPSYIGQTVAQRVYRQLSPGVSATPAPTGGLNHA